MLWKNPGGDSPPPPSNLQLICLNGRPWLPAGFRPYTFGQRVLAYLKNHGRNYDVIHDNQTLSYGVLKLQQIGMPLVTTIHHPITRDRDIALANEPHPGMRLLIRRWHSFLRMQKKVARRLQHIVTVSEASKRDIVAAFAANANIQVLYGVDCNEFRPIPRSTESPIESLLPPVPINH